MLRLLLATLVFLLAGIAFAAEPTDMRELRMTDILAALQAKSEPETVFASSFRAAVPEAQLAALIRKLEDDNGPLIAAENFNPDTATAGRFILRFQRATAAAAFAIEAEAPFRVTSLVIRSVTPLGDSPEKIAAGFAALPGRSGFVVVRLGTTAPLLAAHAQDQFAIGSTFKLWVLDALAEDVAAGRHHWNEVVRLGPRSLPSGITQDWPREAPVTIETLATLMISISDNTATDTLIRLVGRDRIAARVKATRHSDPSRMLPFLTTTEVFALKLSPKETRTAYALANDDEQLRLLAGLAPERTLATGDRASLAGAPLAIDSIEWFASPTDIVGVLDSLRQRSDPRVLLILGVAPTLPAEASERFAFVGYKGGSESGVINQTWLLRARSGEWFVVTASWNDPSAALDNSRFGQLAQRLIKLVADRQK